MAFLQILPINNLNCFPKYYQTMKAFWVKINKAAQELWRDMGAFLDHVSAALFSRKVSCHPLGLLTWDLFLKEAVLSSWLPKSKWSLMKGINCLIMSRNPTEHVAGNQKWRLYNGNFVIGSGSERIERTGKADVCLWWWQDLIFFYLV